MLLTRLLTATVVLALFLGALFFLPPVAWMLCLLPLLLAGAREWAALAGFPNGASWIYAVVTTAAAVGLAVPGVASAHVATLLYGLAVVFWFLVAPWWLRRGWLVKGWPLACVGWIVLLPTWLALVQLQSAPAVLLAFLAVVWIADTSAYLAGRAFGRNKLAPAISPGKTWEGVMGAVAGVSMYYLALQMFFAGRPGAMAGLVGAVAFAALLALSIEGDLFESWLKRQAGVKDSGTLLPGHGGVLDRIDALTSTLPAVALLLQYVG